MIVTDDMVVYNEMMEDAREGLEARFNYAMISNNKIEAHEVLKELMEYRLVNADDERCSINTTMFKNTIISF